MAKNFSFCAKGSSLVLFLVYSGCFYGEAFFVGEKMTLYKPDTPIISDFNFCIIKQWIVSAYTL